MGQGKLKRNKPGSRKEHKESQVHKAVKEAKKLAELLKSAEQAGDLAVIAPGTVSSEQPIR